MGTYKPGSQTPQDHHSCGKGAKVLSWLGQAVVSVVGEALEDFDAVCCATALHKLASLGAPAPAVAAALATPQMTRLKHQIGASLKILTLVLNLHSSRWLCIAAACTRAGLCWRCTISHQIYCVKEDPALFFCKHPLRCKERRLGVAGQHVRAYC